MFFSFLFNVCPSFFYFKNLGQVFYLELAIFTNNSSHLLAFSPCLTHIYPFFYLCFNNQVRLDYRKRSSSFRCIPFPLRFKNQIKFSILENYSSYLCSCTILLPSISLFIFFFLYSNIPFSLCFNNQVRLNRKYLPSQFFILLAYQFLSRHSLLSYFSLSLSLFPTIHTFPLSFISNSIKPNPNHHLKTLDQFQKKNITLTPPPPIFPLIYTRNRISFHSSILKYQ